MCLSRVQFRVGLPPGEPTSLQVAVIECRLDDGRTVDVLDYEFFDDESVVLVLRPTGSPCMVATVAYRDVAFAPASSSMTSREWMVQDAGNSVGNALRVTGARTLRVGGTGGASLAVNGRVGRRTVCVLEENGSEMEVLDMAEDEEIG